MEARIRRGVDRLLAVQVIFGRLLPALHRCHGGNSPHRRQSRLMSADELANIDRIGKPEPLRQVGIEDTGLALNSDGDDMARPFHSDIAIHPDSDLLPKAEMLGRCTQSFGVRPPITPPTPPHAHPGPSPAGRSATPREPTPCPISSPSNSRVRRSAPSTSMAGRTSSRRTLPIGSATPMRPTPSQSTARGSRNAIPFRRPEACNPSGSWRNRTSIA